MKTLRVWLYYFMFIYGKVKFKDILISFSHAMDFINRMVSNHHLRVCVIADEISRAYGLTRSEREDVLIGAALHDIGVFSLAEKLGLNEYELKNPAEHAEKGFLLTNDFTLFSPVCRIIRFHHQPWNEGRGQYVAGEVIPIGSHILHLADRIEILIDKNTEVLRQKDGIVRAITAKRGTLFLPDLVDTFISLAAKEYFWFDAVAPDIEQVLLRKESLPEMELDLDQLMQIAILFSHIIDYRSNFTAVHSSGVSAVASRLAGLAGFSAEECRLMQIAGYLHDIGKLAIPTTILEKPDKLSTYETNLMKSHVYYTYSILSAIPGLETINTWASLHHERMNGSGYPFHYVGRQLPFGSRIMAIADVLTAVLEDRPYRKGMDDKTALTVMEDMAAHASLDKNLVELMKKYYDELNDARIDAQQRSKASYMAMKQAAVVL